MRIVIAPDSFKGSLDAAAVARALAKGWSRARPADTIVSVPVADGGEGTLDALVAAWSGRLHEATVTGPVGQSVSARFGVTPDGRTAVIEMAEASGLPLLSPEQQDPDRATTYGTGELIRAALDLNVERIIVAVGGSATNDGGAGMAQALGVDLYDDAGLPLPAGGAALYRLARVDVSRLDERLATTKFIVAADVDNPLTGPRGASRVFGPQKGAGPHAVARLDDALSHYARRVEATLRPGSGEAGAWSELPGAGAAGGLAFGLVAFCGAVIRSGADVVLDAVGLDEQLQRADVVITGEGRLDGQSMYGKTPVAVARRARRLGIPVIAVAGVLGSGHEMLSENGVTVTVPIAPGPIDTETSMRRAQPLLVACGERIARLVEIGLNVRDDGKKIR